MQTTQRTQCVSTSATQPLGHINTAFNQSTSVALRLHFVQLRIAPYLSDGDVVELGIEGLGEQRQVFAQRR